GAASASASTGAQAGPSASQGNLPTGDTLLTLTRTGGLAGTNDKLVVRPDGTYTLQTRTAARNGALAPSELTALNDPLAAIDFNKMPTANDGPTIADGSTYVVTYNGREVTAHDGSIPPQLQPVISALNGFLNK